VCIQVNCWCNEAWSFFSIIQHYTSSHTVTWYRVLTVVTLSSSSWNILSFIISCKSPRTQDSLMGNGSSLLTLLGVCLASYLDILCIISQSWFSVRSCHCLHILSKLTPPYCPFFLMPKTSFFVVHNYTILCHEFAPKDHGCNWDSKNTSQTLLYWCVFQRGPVSLGTGTYFWMRTLKLHSGQESLVYSTSVRPTSHISSNKTEIWMPLSKTLYTSFPKLTFAYRQFCKLESSIVVHHHSFSW
jgi:hypothetical protein